jgi:NADH-quinone oxidoreductase subunit F
LADGAAWPIRNALTKFRAEFEDYIRSGTRARTTELVASH